MIDANLALKIFISICRSKIAKNVVEAETILLKKMHANAHQISHSSRTCNVLNATFQNTLTFRPKFAHPALNIQFTVLTITNAYFVLHKNLFLMDKNVLNVKQIHFTTEQLFHVKDVVLEEYTTPRKKNANAKTQLYSLMELFAFNATIQSILISTIKHVSYALTIKSIIWL